jgi:hypothetical protein
VKYPTIAGVAVCCKEVGGPLLWALFDPCPAMFLCLVEHHTMKVYFSRIFSLGYFRIFFSIVLFNDVLIWRNCACSAGRIQMNEHGAPVE